MSRLVQIVDVAPRDGLQSEAVVLPTETKIELVDRLVDAGIRRVETVSFARPDRVPQMADAEAVMEALPPRQRRQLRRAGAQRARRRPGRRRTRR